MYSSREIHRERVRQMAVVRYEHHGREVAVQEHLMGRHREHCLCHLCRWFRPENREENCPIANTIYSLDVLTGLTTPVWECPRFQERAE